MNWLTNNLAETLFILGLIILIVEITVLSLSTIILFMLGSSVIITSVLMFLGILDDNLLDATFYIAILTVVLSIVLWRPFKRLQEDKHEVPVSSDLVGTRFVLTEAISPTSSVSHRYSGIEWQLVCNTSLPAGTEVEVMQVEVGQWFVRAVEAQP
mgnify:CR=1 FL=1